MGKSGSKLSDDKIRRIRRAIRALIRENKDLQAAVNSRKKASRAKDPDVKLRSAISKVIVRNPLLQDAAKAIFNKMK